MSEPEATDLRAMTVRLPEAEYTAVRAFADAMGTSMNQVLRLALRHHLTSEDSVREVETHFERVRAEMRTLVEGMGA